jgi:hypothetical protein
MGLARGLPDLGWVEYAACRPAKLANPSAQWRSTRIADEGDGIARDGAAGWGDANPGILFCRDVVRPGSDGSTSAGVAQGGGASSSAAIAAAALVGPAQVGARIVEFGLLRSFHPVSSARIASILHPIGAAVVILFGGPGIVAFALLHGAGNGMITIAKGTLPLALFGPQGYGQRSGLLSVPARVLQSAAPFLFGLLLDRVGITAVGLSAGLCLAAFGSLLLLRPRGVVGAHRPPLRG